MVAETEQGNFRIHLVTLQATTNITATVNELQLRFISVGRPGLLKMASSENIPEGGLFGYGSRDKL